MTPMPKPSGKAISSEQKKRDDEALGIDSEPELTPEEEAALDSHGKIKPAGLTDLERPSPVPPI